MLILRLHGMQLYLPVMENGTTFSDGESPVVRRDCKMTLIV
jgi:hypothetical protein